ncbi:MAG TPA: MFS transporter, partial [Candidatus Bathyarchaeia archaeon]
MTTRRLNLLGSFRTLSRDLRLLFLSLFLWTFGLGLYNYVWPIYLRELQASPEQVGLVFSVGFIAAALSMIPGGILANKYELRKLLIISWAASLPPPITFYLAKTWVEVVPGLVILQLSAFSLPALNAYISAAGDREKMSSAFGTVFSAAPLGIVFSPAVGSVLLNWLRIRDLFLISFLFFTLSTLVLFPIRRQPPLQKDTNSPKLELPRSKHEAVILVLLTGIAVAYSITSPFLPLYSQDILRLNDSQVQLLGATQSLGTAFFAVSLGRLAVSRSKGGTMAMGLSLAAIGVLTIPLAN